MASTKAQVRQKRAKTVLIEISFIRGKEKQAPNFCEHPEVQQA